MLTAVPTCASVAIVTGTGAMETSVDDSGTPAAAVASCVHDSRPHKAGNVVLDCCVAGEKQGLSVLGRPHWTVPGVNTGAVKLGRKTRQ